MRAISALWSCIIARTAISSAKACWPRASGLGLTGVPREAETIILDRDLRLLALTGARYHSVFVSNGLSIAAMERAKQADLAVTCGASINHLTLNEIDVGDYR